MLRAVRSNRQGDGRSAPPVSKESMEQDAGCQDDRAEDQSDRDLIKARRREVRSAGRPVAVEHAPDQQLHGRSLWPHRLRVNDRRRGSATSSASRQSCLEGMRRLPLGPSCWRARRRQALEAPGVGPTTSLCRLGNDNWNRGGPSSPPRALLVAYQSTTTPAPESASRTDTDSQPCRNPDARTDVQSGQRDCGSRLLRRPSRAPASRAAGRPVT